MGRDLVLIVHESRSVQHRLSLTLESAGYDTLTATTARAALGLFGRTAAQLAAVVADVRIPGLDGVELSKKQEEVFTAFLTDNTVDVGLGTLRATHVKAALYLAEEHANAKGLKKWHPMYERLMDLVYHDDSELLKKAKVLAQSPRGPDGDRGQGACRPKGQA